MDNDLELTLINYIPFLQNGVTEMVYTPRKPVQLVLGSNGSGKSSLFSQLSYLPGESSDFDKGGYKKIKFGGYELISDFAKGGSGEHLFIKNGTNLNTGKTLTVQKTLVEKEFGMTKEIHSVLSGAKGYLFTDMSPNKRKEWLTKLSPTNLDFVLEVYQNSATELRDRVGSIKQVSGKLVNLTSNESNDEKETLSIVRDEVAKLENSLSEHRKFKEKLVSLIPKAKQQLPMNTALSEVSVVASEIIKEIHGCKGIMSGVDFDSPEEFISNCNEKITLAKKNISDISAKIDDYQEFIETKAKLPSDDAIGCLKSDVEALKNIIPEDIIHLDPYELERDYLEIRSRLSNLCSSVTFKDTFTKERQTELLNGVENSEKIISALIRNQDKLSFTLSRYLKEKDVACKKCGYFECDDPNVDEDRMSKNIVSLDAAISLERSTLENIKDELDELGVWSSHLKSVRALKERYSHLSNFIWKPLYSNGVIKSCYSDIITFLDEKAVVVENTKKYHKEVKDLSSIIQSAELVGNLKNLTLEAAEMKVVTLSSERSKYINEVKLSQDQIRIAKNINSLICRGDRTLNSVVDAMYTTINDIVSSEMDDAISRIEFAIGHQYKKLSELEGRKNLIEELTGYLNELKSDQHHFKILVDRLSPSTGLIAKILSSSIDAVVGNINQCIDNIWASGLRIQSCNIESGKLDYKFPVVVKDYPVPVKDISLGSDGQRDIINFAFRMVVYKALNIQNYPLFLDEFGSTFDEQHRFNATEYIKMLVEVGGFPYVFFISHYYGQHGGLSNNETLVLDEANVTTPLEYNKHVVLR